MPGYMWLIIREAHKHGGQGWLTYDTVFRHNNQGNSQVWTLGVIPKRNRPNNWRLIVDLSSLEGHSINDELD